MCGLGNYGGEVSGYVAKSEDVGESEVGGDGKVQLNRKGEETGFGGIIYIHPLHARKQIGGTKRSGF